MKPILPDPNLEKFAVKTMTYDALGRMIALTDPDAETLKATMIIHETDVQVYDKTWIVKYDDMGRQKLVIYPETSPGIIHIKSFDYDDERNWTTIIDPEGRTVIEKKDWNNNLKELVHMGESSPPGEDYQIYKYTYDKLSRKIGFIDPKGITTTYHYNERDLLVEQGFGINGSDTMEYNDLGQLVKKTDRNGHVIGFVYDELGRNTEVRHYEDEASFQTSDMEYNVETIYDFRGNPVRIDNQNLIEYYTYDYANRVTSLERYVKVEGINTKVAGQLGSVFTPAVFPDSIFTFALGK